MEAFTDRNTFEWANRLGDLLLLREPSRHRSLRKFIAEVQRSWTMLGLIWGGFLAFGKCVHFGPHQWLQYVIENALFSSFDIYLGDHTWYNLKFLA